MPRGSFVVLANPLARNATRSRVAKAGAALGRIGQVETIWTTEVDYPTVFSTVGKRPLVIAGGDGTLHRVLNEAHRLGSLGRVTFGLLPMGAGNDFARAAGIPHTVQRAVDLIATGHARPFDLILDDASSVTVNVAHFGLSTQASGIARRSKRLLGRFAYPLGTFVAGLRGHHCVGSVIVDGRIVSTGSSILMVAVCNGGFIGGGRRIAPNARADDGQLEVIIVPRLNLWRRGLLGARLLGGWQGALPGAHAFEGSTARIALDRLEGFVSDGELCEDVESKSFLVKHQAWRLIASPLESQT